MKRAVLVRQVVFGLVAASASSMAFASNYSFIASFTDFGTLANPQADVFTISNFSDADIAINQIVIDLSGASNTPVFDTLDGASANYSYGAATGAPVTAVGIADVGFVDLTAAQQAALEEGQVLTLDFTGFESGETFVFTTDVDSLLDFFVSGAEFAGATLTVVFTDGNGNVFSDSGSFQEALGTPAINDAFAAVKGIAVVPVPGALLLMLSALGGLGASRLRRS